MITVPGKLLFVFDLTYLRLKCLRAALLEGLRQTGMYLAERLISMAYVDWDMTLAGLQFLIGRS